MDLIHRFCAFAGLYMSLVVVYSGRYGNPKTIAFPAGPLTITSNFNASKRWLKNSWEMLANDGPYAKRALFSPLEGERINLKAHPRFTCNPMRGVFKFNNSQLTNPLYSTLSVNYVMRYCFPEHAQQRTNPFPGAPSWVMHPQKWL